MNISLNRQENTVQMQLPDHLKAQKGSKGGHKLLLQDVKVGDLLKVEVINSLQKQISLMLADGTIFEAKLDQPLNLHIGQEVLFQVKDIIGKQVLMEIALEGEQVQGKSSADINNILKQLDLPITPDSKEAVKFLMQKMMPLTKDNIIQIEFGLKTSQLPIDSILSMLENEIPVTPNNLSQVEAYENGQIKLQGQLEAIIDNIMASDQGDFLDQVYTALKASKEQIDQLEQPGILKNPQPLQGLQDPLYGGDIEGLKKEITDLFKEVLFLSPEKIKDQAESKLQKINQFYREIYELVDRLEKIQDQGPGQSDRPEEKIYSEVKSNIEFLALANKYDTVIHIPLLIQDQYKHGELYIFNNKKKKKKGYSQASMLISLETIHLGTVETYIKKNNKQVSAQFKTDNKAIEEIFKSKINLLKTRLKAKGYDLTGVSYVPADEAFRVKEEASKPINVERYRFDTKA